MLNETPRRSTIRLTRRGRIVLLATGAVVAAAAVAVPLTLSGDEGRPEALTIPEGWRAGQVYDAVDQALEVPAGTTRKAAAKANLKLPSDASGNPEGYLFPATYPLDDKSTPQSVLAYMVATANQKFNGPKTTAGAPQNATSQYQTVTIASIVEAEADNKEDMGKVARVIYNRLDHGMPLQMDSTLNYGLGRSTLTTSKQDLKSDSPYNTYARMGLPPSPIGNPGEQAMKAAANPTPGEWLYFVTVKPGDTRFTADYAEQQKNVAEFNKSQAAAKRDG
ncbi:endolytic transglycosylase MltG [Streptomyces sp. VRA16 Mangrove soil]|uniref:endolytic transglycosylase MltG n=1 Tax=Streptomyces sp. VRA16 Mangrove soil TaxID=2817434 RepID=UPI001A9E984A|nr:endolytic transglycosylase MltG [Streptomyces sp. VRA16 Mangrove soil]MBO1332332.1 endolytic transglycosylase MltG [Streptomyces sp. VRA16 Mangrove soil]